MGLWNLGAPGHEAIEFTFNLKNTFDHDVTLYVAAGGPLAHAAPEIIGSPFIIDKNSTGTIGRLVLDGGVQYEFRFDDHENDTTLSVV